MQTDLAGPDLDGKLGVLFESAYDRSRRERRPTLVSFTESVEKNIDPLDLFAAAGPLTDKWFWSQPDTGLTLTGLGAAHIIETTGPHRFSATAASWRALCSRAMVQSPAGWGPLLLGGFAFDTAHARSPEWEGFPDGRMVVPRVCLIRYQGRQWLTSNAVIGPDVPAAGQLAEVLRLQCLLTAPKPDCRSVCIRPAVSDLRSPAEWRDEVAAAARAVRRGELGKVVLARSVRLQSARDIDCLDALRRLRSGYPSCVVFAIAHGGRCFLGATPERLLKVSGGELSTTCLAGSYPRGATPAEDAKLARALLSDPKERREHALVLDDLADKLTVSCAGLDLPVSPSVLKLPNVQHLCSPISGRLAPGRSILQIIEQIHPTPSVGGQPRELALRFIREREGMDRGWYAGPVGWVDHRGEGEFAVAIRAALLCGQQATLFAGCGIVADSDPNREYTESCIKLTPMLTALGAQ